MRCVAAGAKVPPISLSDLWDVSVFCLKTPRVKSIDWTWFGINTPVSMKSHSCQWIREQKPLFLSHKVEGTACKPQRHDCVDTLIWGRLQKHAAALKVPQSTVDSIILKQKMGMKRKTCRTTRTLPGADSPEKRSNQERWVLVREVTKNSMDCVWRWVKPPDGQP